VREEAVVGSDLSDADMTSVDVEESRFEDVELSRATLRGASLRDVVVERGSWANVDAKECGLTRVAFRGVRMTGARFPTATIRDASFAECRLDFASFRFARLERVRFEDCRLVELDLYETRLESVAFDRCDLTKADLSKSTFSRCEMRDCELAGVASPERLRGVSMPWPDVVRSAVVLADAVGIRLLDDD